MKKSIYPALFLVIFVLLFPLCVFASDGGVEVPVLKSVSFNNAQLEGDFSSEKFEYDICSTRRRKHRR